jgi:hypothetical protein
MTDRATHCGQTQEVFDRPPNAGDAVIDAHGVLIDQPVSGRNCEDVASAFSGSWL